MRAKIVELEASIARARRAKSLIQQALACPHRNLVTCPNFRSALKPYFDSREGPGHAEDEKVISHVMRHRVKGARGIAH